MSSFNSSQQKSISSKKTHNIFSVSMADPVLTQAAILIIVNLGLAAVVGYLLGRTRLLDEQNGKLTGIARKIVGILIFGIMSVLGTATGITSGDVLLNVRDGGPIMGGLWFGPVIGIGAAVLGAAYRFTIGGATMIPCVIATLVSGVVSGILYLYFREKITILTSALIACGLMVIHMLLTVLLTPDGIGYKLVFESPTGIGIILIVTLAVALFSWCYNFGKASGETAE